MHVYSIIVYTLLVHIRIHTLYCILILSLLQVNGDSGGEVPPERTAGDNSEFDGANMVQFFHGNIYPVSFCSDML